jgi:hypothetical protein
MQSGRNALILAAARAAIRAGSTMLSPNGVELKVPVPAPAHHASKSLLQGIGRPGLGRGFTVFGYTFLARGP